MTAQDPIQHRERRARRTTTVRRGVVAAGTVGALGAAVAVGVTTHTGGGTSPTADQDRQGVAPRQGDRVQAQRARTESDDRESDDGESDDRVAPRPATPHRAPARTQNQAPATGNGGQLASPGGSAPSQGQSGGS